METSTPLPWYLRWRHARGPSDGNGTAHAAHGVRVSLDELIGLRLQAAGLNVAGRRKVMNVMAGGHRSGFRGRGYDFSETRHYQPGDDIRAMDWRVTARYGVPHTKLFQEERERPVLLLADLRANMQFGTRTAFKSVIAARALALLAWAAAAHGDRVGGLVFGDHGHREIRPAGGRRGVLRLLKCFADGIRETNSPDYSLDRALEQIHRVTRPGTLVCVASDFHGLGAAGRSALQRMAAHADVFNLFVFDPLETELPPPGAYPLSDGERLMALETHHADLREQYRSAFAARYAGLEQLCRPAGLRLLPLATDADLNRSLRRGLQQVEAGRGSSHAPEWDLAS